MFGCNVFVMAYVAGTVTDFEQRLHSLAVTEADLDSYFAEAQTYTGTALAYQVVKWDREFLKRYGQLGLPVPTP